MDQDPHSFLGTKHLFSHDAFARLTTYLERRGSPDLHAYLDCILKFYLDEDYQLDNFIKALEHPDHFSLVEKTVAEIKKYEKPFDRLTNPIAQGAAQALKEGIAHNKEKFHGMGITLVVGGSILYDDPKKGDLDMTTINIDNPNKFAKIVAEDIGSFYKGGIECTPCNPSDFIAFSNPIEPLDLEFSDNLYHTSLVSIYILTGRPVFDPNNNYTIVRDQAMNLLKSSPLAAATAFYKLQEMLARRKG